MYACLCKGLTESAVRQVIRSGVATTEALVSALGLDQDDCCGRCILEIDRFLALGTREEPSISPRGHYGNVPPPAAHHS
jgi:bacterioferritin-associated ferredoxin